MIPSLLYSVVKCERNFSLERGVQDSVSKQRPSGRMADGAESVPQNTQDLTVFVQNLLQQMVSC